MSEDPRPQPSIVSTDRGGRMTVSLLVKPDGRLLHYYSWATERGAPARRPERARLELHEVGRAR
jgi:hypothetical protein